MCRQTHCGSHYWAHFRGAGLRVGFLPDAFCKMNKESRAVITLQTPVNSLGPFYCKLILYQYCLMIGSDLTDELTCQICPGDFQQPLVEAFDRVLSSYQRSVKPDQQHAEAVIFEAFPAFNSDQSNQSAERAWEVSKAQGLTTSQITKWSCNMNHCFNLTYFSKFFGGFFFV